MSASSSKRVAVVTGSNKGIGLEIVKGLSQAWDGDVILCSRDQKRGEEAVKNIQEQGIANVKLAILAVDDNDSVLRLKDRLLKDYEGLDILINNAAIGHLTEDFKPLIEIATATIDINVKSTKNVCDTLFPILRPGARVVNVSSSLGMLMMIPGEDLRKRLGSSDLTRQELDQIVQEYLQDVREGKHVEKGWPNAAFSTYITSKVFLSALTWIQHRQFLQDPREDIVINAVHPGYVVTDMTGNQGDLTPEEGAKAPIKCALVPPFGQPRGQMVSFDGSVVDWNRDIIPTGILTS